MITKDSIEQTYCFFHQKWRVYSMSSSEIQKDEIEYAISSYVVDMNKSLYDVLSESNHNFLLSHCSFSDDLSDAVDRLENMM